MSNVLRLAVVDPSDRTRDGLKTTLLGMDMVWLEAECSRYEFFADVVAQTHPDIGIVAIDHNPEKALQLVAQLHESAPTCSILVISSSTDGNLILKAMRAGVKEFLTQPLRIEDLAAALGRISDHRLGRGDRGSRASTVIAVAGATGGVGTTSVAVNLGCAGHRSGRIAWRWSISICAWATPTSFSTRSPITRWSTWHKTSPGWILPCSSDR